jgi:hypothetical protein
MIRAHKLVLSAGSGYLERVLAVTPCDHPTVVLANIRYKELKLLIDFVYTGNPAALRQYFYFKRVSFCCGESPGVVDLTWEIFFIKVKVASQVPRRTDNYSTVAWSRWNA